MVSPVKTRRDPIARTSVELARHLRSNPAAAERTAWRLLRNRRVLGLKFRRQHPIARFVVDFYCAELRLVLEIDGGVHDDQRKSELDDARSAWLETRGYRVLRVRSGEVSEPVLKRLVQEVLSLRSPSPHRGEGVRG
jgi:very-short-patch-repair endonuclease